MFQAQMEKAKKSKVVRMQTTEAYIELFEEALALFKGACAFCQVYGKDVSKHPIFKCPTLANDLETVSTDGFKQWQMTLRYDPMVHKTVCFFCHLPQLDDSIHGTILAKGQGCEAERKDILSPIAFGVFYSPELKSAAEERFEVEWPTLSAYTRWLNGAPVHGHYTNMSGVFIWYFNRIRG